MLDSSRDKYELIKVDEYVFQVLNNEDGEHLVAEDIVELLNNNDKEISKLKSDCTFYQYENEKHIERYKLILEEMMKLQQMIRENKTDKEMKLEKELNDCEKFRYNVFKMMGELNKIRGKTE